MCGTMERNEGDSRVPLRDPVRHWKYLFEVKEHVFYAMND